MPAHETRGGLERLVIRGEVYARSACGVYPNRTSGETTSWPRRWPFGKACRRGTALTVSPASHGLWRSSGMGIQLPPPDLIGRSTIGIGDFPRPDEPAFPEHWRSKPTPQEVCGRPPGPPRCLEPWKSTVEPPGWLCPGPALPGHRITELDDTVHRWPLPTTPTDESVVVEEKVSPPRVTVLRRGAERSR